MIGTIRMFFVLDLSVDPSINARLAQRLWLLFMCTWAPLMRIWFVAQDHPPTDNWQRPDESMNTKRSWKTAKGCYQQGLFSSTDLNVEEAVGRAGTRGVETRLHVGIYTNMKIKSQFWIQHTAQEGVKLKHSFNLRITIKIQIWIQSILLIVYFKMLKSWL